MFKTISLKRVGEKGADQRNFGNGVIRACPLNVKNIVKRDGQYNKFFSHKESKVT